MNAEYLHGFYLGNVLVEPLKGRVSGKNGTQRLPPKAAEVLVCLARRAGAVVEHEELLEQVWGAGQGSREALSHAVGDIRHALGDHHDNPTYIQTLPTRGYRLVVEPVPADAHTGSIVIGADGGATITDFGLLENLKRRGVLETAIAYAVLGWLIIQVVDIVFANLGLPNWVGTFVTVLVIAGFPIALILSWFLEIRDGNATLDDRSPLDARRRRFSRTYVSVVGALGAAAVIVFVYDRYIGLPDVAQEPPTIEIPEPVIAENSIAVLPFLNNDGSDETQTFANGLVDDVITRLSRVPGLSVTSRGDSFTLHPNSPSDRVRQRLEVAMYLEGSVEIRDEQIRVIVQLIDSDSGFHIQSRSFDRPRQDFFEIRDEITQLTVSSLRASLPNLVQDIPLAETEDPGLDVYLVYRRGVDELYKPRTMETTAAAIAWFDTALDMDPEFAAAHAGRCEALVWQFVSANDARLIDEGEAACTAALELSPNLDVVHVALGELYRHRGLFLDTANANRDALRINPNNVPALLGLAEAQRLLGDADAAVETLDSAIGLQPGNWRPYLELGALMFRMGRFDEAAAQYLKVIAIDDSSMRGYTNLGTSYMLAGRFEEALPVYQRAIAIGPDFRTYTGLGLMHYYLGDYDQAIAAMRSAVNLRPNSHGPWMNLGDVLYVSGRLEEARDAFAKTQQFLRTALDVNPNEATNLMDLAWSQAMLGDESLALQTIARAQALTPDDPYAWYTEALIQNELRNTDATLEALEKAVDRGFSEILIGAEPHFANLTNVAGFRELADGP